MAYALTVRSGKKMSTERLVVPLNYSRKAIPDMEFCADAYQHSGNKNLSSISNAIGSLLSVGEHFIMPENGRYSDNPQMGQETLDLFNLPYPVTIAEFSMAADNIRDDFHVFSVPKRISVAFEVNTDVSIGADIFDNYGLSNLSGWLKDPGAVIWPIDWSPDIGRWGPSYCGMFVSYGQELMSPTDESLIPWQELGWSSKKAGCVCSPIVPDDPVIRSANLTPAQILSDTNTEVVSMFELCTVLNCKNIRTEKISQQRLNKKRVKKGKPPYFDYHVLRVEKQGGKHSKSVTKSDRNSPRTHMRRGHIRRLQSGAVWVSNSIVNPGNGFIDKDYLL